MCSKFEEGLNLEVREKMSVFDNQDYKQVVQLALRAKKLTNEWVAKESSRKRRVLDSCLGNPRRRVEILNLWVTYLDLVQNRSAHPKQSDLHHHLDLARHHLILLPEDELHQKSALVVVSFTLGLAVLLKCVFNVDKCQEVLSDV